MSLFYRLSTRPRSFGAALLLVGFALLGPVSADAQVQVQIKSIKVDKPDLTMLKTPDFNANTGKIKETPRRREWLELEVKFEVEGKSANDYVDNLLFKYYIVLDDDKKTMVTADVTHVNIPIGEEMYSSVYLSPSSLDKLVGKKKGSERSVEGYAVEILHLGQSYGGTAKPSSPTRWWQARPATQGLLLSKDKTPYAPLRWDRFAEVKSQP